MFGYPHSTPSLTLGSWQLFHPGKAFGHELLDRTGSQTSYDKPGNCGAGCGGATTATGPYDCGTRSGDPQISISNLSGGMVGIVVADVKAEIRPYSNCPVFYASDAAAAGFESVFTRLPVKTCSTRASGASCCGPITIGITAGAAPRPTTTSRLDGQLDPHPHASLEVSWTLTLTRH